MKGAQTPPADDDARYSGIQVLLIEDDITQGRQLRDGLSCLGFSVEWARYGFEAAALAGTLSPDVVLLDLQLNDMKGLGGIAVCEQIHSRLPGVPIHILTVQPPDGELLGRLADAGACGYTRKPCNVELLAFHIYAAHQQAGCVREMARATHEGRPRRIQLSGMLVDLDEKQVFVQTREVILTPKEFAVVALLAENLGSLVTYDRILERCWGPEWVGSQNRYNLRQLIAVIRKKIESDPHHPRYLRTRLGHGYCLVDPEFSADDDSSSEQE